MLAATSSAADAANLSEAELLARYPALALAASALFLLGLVCDVYLLFRLTSARRSSTADGSAVFKVQPKPWGLHELAIASLAVLAALAMGGGMLAAMIHHMHLSEAGEISSLMVGEILMYIAIFTGFLWYFRRQSLDVPQTFGLRPPSSRGAIVSGLIFYLAILPPLAVVFAVYAKLCQIVGIERNPQPIVDLFVSSDSVLARSLLIGFAIVVAPVSEEFFFRGFAYPALKQRWGMWRALAIVSGAFALVHQHAPSIGPLFALAVGLGLAYEFTGSLLAPITMHALFNATNVAMLLYVRAHS